MGNSCLCCHLSEEAFLQSASFALSSERILVKKVVGEGIQEVGCETETFVGPVLGTAS